jgi:hypothetical protein
LAWFIGRAAQVGTAFETGIASDALAAQKALFINLLPTLLVGGGDEVILCGL